MPAEQTSWGHTPVCGARGDRDIVRGRCLLIHNFQAVMRIFPFMRAIPIVGSDTSTGRKSEEETRRVRRGGCLRGWNIQQFRRQAWESSGMQKDQM